MVVFGIDPSQCGKTVASASGADKEVLFALLAVARVEACAFAAVFVASIYGLLNSANRKPVFLFNAVLFLCAAATHGHHLGLFGPEPGYVVKLEGTRNLLIGDTVLGSLALISFLFATAGPDKEKAKAN
jgi:hypothetical protein